MWATLALLTALQLTPAQAGQLRLTNDRATYGKHGATRADNKLLPGDSFVVQFDIENVEVGKDGKVLYSIGLEFLDAKDQVKFKQSPQEMEITNVFGGNRIPAFAEVEIGLDTPPGEYTFKVQVADRRAKTSQTLVRKFEVLPKDFGILRLQTTNGQALAPPIGVVGQDLVIDFATAGFGRDKTRKQPSILVEMNVLDDAGKPTLEEPMKYGTEKDVPESYLSLRWIIPLRLNRPGKFTVELKATDQVSKKTSKVSFPVTVLEQK